MRPRGTGSVYEKHGSWYGRWRSAAGQRLNRKIGPVRSAHRADGLTRGEAERRFREMQALEDERPTPGVDERHTVDEACSALRRKLAYVGVSRSYAANCERKQRLHIGPAMGEKELHRVTRRDVERLGEELIARGLSPKTVRNTLTFLHQVFEHAIDLEWTRENPVRRATRPRRRRAGDANPDLQFLNLEELEAVIRAIPDEVVVREHNPYRNGRRGPSPPPPPDVLGPVLGVCGTGAPNTPPRVTRRRVHLGASVCLAWGFVRLGGGRAQRGVATVVRGRKGRRWTRAATGGACHV